MSNNSAVLGINCAHDAAACLLINGQIAIAIAEERLTRVKHAEGFPKRALRICKDMLQHNNYKRVDCLVLNQMLGSDFEVDISKELSRLQVSRTLINPSHHFLHACYARSACDFDETAILVVDGSGYSYGEYLRRNSPCLGPKPMYDDCCEAMSSYIVRGDNIEVVDKNWGIWFENTDERYRFPSLGHMYSLAAQVIFGSWSHAGKVMGLAPFGDPGELPFDIVSLHDNGITVDTDWIFHVPPVCQTDHPEADPVAPHVAAKVQYELERAMLHLTEILWRKTGSENLCLTGGVALNSVCNSRILQEGPFREVFMTPAANDAGVALGAAAYGHRQSTGAFPSYAKSKEFLGCEYSDSEIIEAFHQTPAISWERISDQANVAAKDVASGRIVGWFEGRSEFGPRALGHRSILADARRDQVSRVLNTRVKFRETFRPYAAAVLEEYCCDFFELNKPSPWMLLVAKVRPHVREEIPGVVHTDGSCRIQTVAKDCPGRFREVLESFHRLTRIPLLVNTSLNIRGEPICETPADAIRCFLHSGIDVLYLNEFRATKIQLSLELPKDLIRVPVIHEGTELKSESLVRNGDWVGMGWTLTYGAGLKTAIADSEARLLRCIDGKRSIADLANLLKSTYGKGQLLSKIRNLECKGILHLRDQ